MSIRENSTYNGKIMRRISFFCRFVFCLFCIFYLFFFQKELLEIKYEKYLSDKIPYLSEGLMVVGIILLMLLQWGVSKLSFNKKWIALSYLPSFLLLGILTYYKEFYIPVFNAVLLVLLLTLFSLPALKASRKWLFDKNSYPIHQLNINLLLMVILSMFTLSIGNTQINYHYELAANHYLNERNWEKLLKVGHKALTPSHKLTVLRFIALMKNHEAGEYLFEYPQLYGTKGLVFSEVSEENIPIDSLLNFYYLPENIAYTEEEIEAFLKKRYEESENKEVAFNYYAASLLLQKKIDEFVKLIGETNFFSDGYIPKHYQEALILAEYLSSGSHDLLLDEENYKRFISFMELKEKAVSKADKNELRRKYGNTYWGYYYR